MRTISRNQNMIQKQVLINFFETTKKEVEKFKQLYNENEIKINELNDYIKSLEFEVKRCRLDICSLVKESEEYKRKIKKKEISEKQFSIGKIRVEKTSNGQLIEYFEEGEEFQI